MDQEVQRNVEFLEIIMILIQRVYISLEKLYLDMGYDREKQEVVGRGKSARGIAICLSSPRITTNDLIAHCHATRDF